MNVRNTMKLLYTLLFFLIIPICNLQAMKRPGEDLPEQSVQKKVEHLESALPQGQQLNLLTDLPPELRQIILSFLFTAEKVPGQRGHYSTQQSKLSAVTTNIRSLMFVNKQYYEWLNRQDITGSIIQMLATRYTKGHLLEAAFALGTRSAATWLGQNFATNQILQYEIINWFFEAARYGKLDVMQFLLSAHPHLTIHLVNAKQNNTNGLMLAAGNGQIEVARQLIKASAPINAAYDINYTALLVAAVRGYTQMVELLLQAGADPNIMHQEAVSTPLSQASSKGFFDIVQLLLRYNANPNLQTSLGQTALMAAASNGFTNIVRLLLQAKAQVNLRNDNGLSALLYAIKSGNSEVVDILLEHYADANLPDIEGITPLMEAVEKGNMQLVERLFRADANVNQPNRKGGTPLMLAARSAGKQDIIKLLIAKGAHLDAQEAERGYTALNLASIMGYAHIVQLLLDAGANPNIQTKDGTALAIVNRTALHNKQDIIKVLQDHGAHT